MAGLAGQGSLVVGNVIGANFINATVVLGLAAGVGRSILIKGKTWSCPSLIILLMAQQLQ